jgi:hypothetical protein
MNLNKKENKKKINISTEDKTDQNKYKKIDLETITKRGYNPHRLVDSIVKEDNVERN